jgi:peptidyl-dipeptidase A
VFDPWPNFREKRPPAVQAVMIYFECAHDALVNVQSNPSDHRITNHLALQTMSCARGNVRSCESFALFRFAWENRRLPDLTATEEIETIMTRHFAASIFLALFLMEFSTDMSIASDTRGRASAEADARAFIEQHEASIRPLEHEAALTWWNANVTGRDQDFKAKEDAQNRLDAALADAERFARLKKLKASQVSDPLLARQIAVLYLLYLEKQVDPALLRQITAIANSIEKTFNAYRANVSGRTITDSEVRRILKESRSSSERKVVWEGSKGVGPLVAPELKTLVKLRNEAARRLGFATYHVLQLHLGEQSQEQVLKLFDELDELTRAPFRRLKLEVDAKLAEQSRVSTGDLRPWHYHDPFFQEAPAVFAADFDSVYARADILKLCREFYDGIGLPIDDVIARSDLYEKPGKSPHAFCTDIDRKGDVRVLANIVPNEYWMGTMLHELGHAVYSSKNIPPRMPYVLRLEAHILTTEGIAMLFERFSKDADWLSAMGVTVPDPAEFDRSGARMLRAKLLVFSRWCQVMLRFEKALYDDPDQDLDTLWWDLVAKYQMVQRPDGRHAPDYASKIHIVSTPVYYHNYLMGELFALQVLGAIARDVLHGVDPAKASFVRNKAVGEFLRTRIFDAGRSLDWNALTKHATGETLNAKAFATSIARE